MGCWQAVVTVTACSSQLQIIENRELIGHRDELLRHGGVKCHGAVEVSLGGPHAYGNGSHLDDFRSVLTTMWQPSTFPEARSTINLSSTLGPRAGRA